MDINLVSLVSTVILVVSIILFLVIIYLINQENKKSAQKNELSDKEKLNLRIKKVELAFATFGIIIGAMGIINPPNIIITINGGLQTNSTPTITPTITITSITNLPTDVPEATPTVVELTQAPTVKPSPTFDPTPTLEPTLPPTVPETSDYDKVTFNPFITKYENGIIQGYWILKYGTILNSPYTLKFIFHDKDSNIIDESYFHVNIDYEAQAKEPIEYFDPLTDAYGEFTINCDDIVMDYYKDPDELDMNIEFSNEIVYIYYRDALSMYLENLE